MKRARERFRRVAAQFDDDLPLIGVVGEIFCRLNTFSNEDLIRKLETYGAEGWLSDIAEWIQYTNSEQVRKLKLLGRFWSMDMLKARLRWHVQNSDEHAIAKPFKEDFVGQNTYRGVRVKTNGTTERVDITVKSLPAKEGEERLFMFIFPAPLEKKGVNEGTEGYVEVADVGRMKELESELACTRETAGVR